MNKALVGTLAILAIPIGIPLAILILAIILGLVAGIAGLALALTIGVVLLIIGVLAIIFGLWIAAIIAAISIIIAMFTLALVSPIIAIVAFAQGSMSFTAVLFGIGLTLILIPLTIEFCRLVVRIFKGSINFSTSHIRSARSSRGSRHASTPEAKVKKTKASSK